MILVSSSAISSFWTSCFSFNFIWEKRFNNMSEFFVMWHRIYIKINKIFFLGFFQKVYAKASLFFAFLLGHLRPIAQKLISKSRLIHNFLMQIFRHKSFRTVVKETVVRESRFKDTIILKTSRGIGENNVYTWWVFRIFKTIFFFY